MVALTEIFLPSKSSTTTYYDEYNDPWFRQRFNKAETFVIINIDNFAKLKESLDVAEQNVREVADMRRHVHMEIMRMKAEKKRIESAAGIRQ